MYGMRSGIRSDMLPWTTKVIGFQDNRADWLISSLGPYITEE